MLPDKLNERQMIELESYARMWRSYAFSTERADRYPTGKAIDAAYKQAGLKVPRIVWCESPLQLLFGYDVAVGVHDLYKSGGVLTWERAFNITLRDIDLGELVINHVQNVPISRAESEFPEIRQVGGYFVGGWGHIDDFSHHVITGLSKQLVSFAPAMNETRRFLRTSLELKTGGIEQRLTRPIGLGQMDSARMAMYHYCHDILEIDALAPLRPLWTIAQNASWWLPCEHICFVSERPTVQLFDADGRLHAELGAAMQFEDGYSLYAWHGMSVHEDVILHPERITVEQIEGERNAEIRRVLIERFGIGEYLEASGFDVLSTDEYGVLVRKEQRGDEPIVMVKVFNSTPEPDGSTKVYWLPVPPRYVHHNIQDEAGVLRALGSWGNRDWNSPKEAIAWGFGLSEAEYNPSQET